MALVNEPRDQLPNALPFYDAYGLCADHRGRAGIPYYAVREIGVREEVLVCYGPSYRRRYSSVCADAGLLAR
eukprot:718709-Prymnesium_polylepis.1